MLRTAAWGYVNVSLIAVLAAASATARPIVRASAIGMLRLFGARTVGEAATALDSGRRDREPPGSDDTGAPDRGG